jgi:hypothetical protein
MGTDVNASVSVAASSGAQGGNIETGGITIGGSGGTNKTPVWVLIAAVAVGVLVLGFLFFHKK